MTTITYPTYPLVKMLAARRYRVIYALWKQSSASYTTGSGSVEASKEPEGKGKEISVAVSSLRVDTVAAAGLDISRKCVCVCVCLFVCVFVCVSVSVCLM